jgi:hypothetical protein
LSLSGPSRWHDRKLLLDPLCFRKDDMVAGEPRVGNGKNNDPRLIAPIAVVG